MRVYTWKENMLCCAFVLQALFLQVALLLTEAITIVRLHEKLQFQYKQHVHKTFIF